MQTVIISGVTSFLGRNCASLLLKKGYCVVGLVRPNSRNRMLLSGLEAAGLRIVDLDFDNLPEAEPEHYREVLGRNPSLEIAAFLHFSWDGSGPSGRSDSETQKRNAENAKKALLLADNLHCGKFIFSGSQAEYGTNHENPSPVSEYGKEKLHFAEWAEAYCSENHTAPEFLHLRIFSVYGPGDHASSLVNSLVRSARDERPLKLGPCTQMWNYLEIEDFTRAVLLLVEQGESGIYDVAGGQTRPLRELVLRIESQALTEYGRSRGEADGLLLFGERGNNPEGAANMRPDTTKLCALGFRPEVTLEEGVRILVQAEKNRKPVRRCLSCGGELQKLDVFHNMPSSAQDIPDQEELSKDHPIDLMLCQCTKCGLVQFDTEPVSYYKDVIRAGGGTTTMLRLRHEEYNRLLDEMETAGGKSFRILEVGCGAGEFLKMWETPESWRKGRLEPVEVSGIEHRRDLVEKAKQDGLTVYEDFAENGKTLPGGLYDAFVQFNFLEHQPHPADMLQTIRRNLKEGGIGLVTVPSFEYILKYDGFYELLRDHIANYTEFTLQKLFADNGFETLAERIVNRDTIEILVRKADPDTLTKLCFNGKLVNVDPLQKNYRFLKQEMDALLARLSSENRTLAIWGAGHQGFTLASTMNLGGRVKYIIDSALFKQNRFAPASHIPIVPPEHFREDPADVVLVCAPGYTDEIAGIIRQKFGAGVEILVLRTDHVTVWQGRNDS